jgi:hypothetical protein
MATRQSSYPDFPALLAFSSAPAVATEPERMEGGQPARLFRKELIQCGQWTHPATGQTIDITPDVLRHWQRQFIAMSAAGIQVPIPATHTADPEANRGYLKGLELSKDGRHLFGIIDLIGEDAIKLAGRTDVSIFAEDVPGSNKEVYRFAIEHVAVVTDPVIPGLSGWQALAAAQGRKFNANTPIFFAQKVPTMANVDTAQLTGIPSPDGMSQPSTPPGAKPGKGLASQIKDHYLGQMSTKLAAGIDDPDADHKALCKEVLEMLKQASTMMQQFVEQEEAEPDDGEPTDDQLCKALSKRGMVMSKKPESVHPMMLKLARKDVDRTINDLARECRLSPAAVKIINAEYIRTDGAGLAMSLARGETETELDRLFKVLRANNPVALGEQTRAQAEEGKVLALSNSYLAKPDDESEKVRIRERDAQRKRMGLAPIK